MKQLLTVLIVISFLAVPLHARADSPGDARTSIITGNVYLKASDTNNEWKSVSINMPVMQDDTYWVSEDSKAEIQFFGSTYLRADQDTQFQVTSIDESSDTVTISLLSGRVYVDYAGSSDGSLFQIDAPLVSVDADSGARFDVNISNDGVTEVSVVSGSVRIDSESGSSRINAGNMVSFSGSGTAEVSSYTPDDSWMDWNASQDNMLEENSPSAEYLPQSLSDYSYEFDINGSWTYEPYYGEVWAPAIVTPGWAPYTLGRWVWIRGNYVWVSYESWGWVPYHYGRWAFRPGIGWFWVPPSAQQAFWCPGLVAWNYTPTYVSWVPLAPGEVYYGYGNYGPQSINLRNTPTNRIAAPYYRNASISNAVTVVSRETFVSGNEYRKLKLPENPFFRGKYVTVERPPDTRPMRDGRAQFTPPGLPNHQTRLVAQPQEPAQQFRQVNPPGIPNHQTRMVTGPQEPAQQFRQVTPPGMPNHQTRMVAQPQEPAQQFRQVTPPGLPNNQSRTFAQPQQPFGQFRQAASPGTSNNRYIRGKNQSGSNLSSRFN